MTAPHRIVVGVDGSAPSQRALTWAGDLAAAIGGQVVAVQVLGLLRHHPPAGNGAEGSAADRRAEADAQLAAWCDPVRRQGVAVRTLVVDGSPAPALLSVAAEEGADLIVVGPRGSGPAPELQLGSTSHELVTRSPVPVAVVPAPH